MYRDVVAVAKSYYRLSMVIPILRLRSLLGSYPTQMTKVIANWMGMVGMVGSDFSESQNNDLAYGVLIHAEAISVYLDARRRGFDVSAVRRALRGPRCSSSRRVPRHPRVLSPARVAGRARRQSAGPRLTKKLDIRQVAHRPYERPAANAGDEGDA